MASAQFQSQPLFNTSTDAPQDNTDHLSVVIAQLPLLLVLLGTAVAFGTAQGTLKWPRKLISRFEYILGGPKHNLKLPGPPGVPLFGILTKEQLAGNPSETYRKWSLKYGGAFRLPMGAREVLCINSYAAAANLYLTQGAAFISRPQSRLFHKEFSTNAVFTVGSSPWNDSCFRKRKAAAVAAGKAMVPSYVPTIQREVVRHIAKLLKTGGRVVEGYDPIQHLVAQMTIGFMFGVELAKYPQKLTQEVIDVEEAVITMRVVGGAPEDYVPVYRMWEEFKAKYTSKGLRAKLEFARATRARQTIVVDTLMSDLKNQIKEGDETPSIVGAILRNPDNKLTDAELGSIILSGMGGVNNASKSLGWLIGYLASHPELQERAYQAIHEVYAGAPPNPEDGERVEYIKALHTEGNRMYAVVRISFPRETVSEATWDGVKIPTGTMAVLNTWAVNMDPTRYERPEEFHVERWLNGRKGMLSDPLPGATKPKETEAGVPHFTFGAGRRVCTGVDLGNREIYIALSLLVHWFTWERAPLGPEYREKVERWGEASSEFHPIDDAADPAALSVRPKPWGVTWKCRDVDGLRSWLTENGMEY